LFHKVCYFDHATLFTKLHYSFLQLHFCKNCGFIGIFAVFQERKEEKQKNKKIRDFF